MSQMVGPQRHQALVLNNALTDPSILLEVKNEDNCLEMGYYVHHKKLGEGLDQTLNSFNKFLMNQFSGGFGKVCLATHLKTGHKVAVKAMNKHRLGVRTQSLSPLIYTICLFEV